MSGGGVGGGRDAAASPLHPAKDSAQPPAKRRKTAPANSAPANVKPAPPVVPAKAAGLAAAAQPQAGGANPGANPKKHPGPNPKNPASAAADAAVELSDLRLPGPVPAPAPLRGDPAKEFSVVAAAARAGKAPGTAGVAAGAGAKFFSAELLLAAQVEIGLGQGSSSGW